MPVACKKCSCGHTFFTSRRSAAGASDKCTTESNTPSTSSGTASTAASVPADSSPPNSGSGPGSEDDFNELPRRTGRIQREKPRFYDALEEMKKVIN